MLNPPKKFSIFVIFPFIRNAWYHNFFYRVGQNEIRKCKDQKIVFKILIREFNQLLLEIQIKS
jgi:hypothetical protein